MSRTLAILLLALASCAASACDIPLSLSVPREVYDRTEPVQFTVFNYCSKQVRFYASLEAQEADGHWSHWPFQISGSSGYANPIYVLEPNVSKTLTFDIRNAHFPPIPEGAEAQETESLKFRFRVTAMDKVGPGVKTESVSSSFVIVNPFDDPGAPR